MYVSHNLRVLPQAHQDSGEFIVLNAGAYHSGYNQVCVVEHVIHMSGHAETSLCSQDGLHVQLLVGTCHGITYVCCTLSW